MYFMLRHIFISLSKSALASNTLSFALSMLWNNYKNSLNVNILPVSLLLGHFFFPFCPTTFLNHAGKLLSVHFSGRIARGSWIRAGRSTFRWSAISSITLLGLIQILLPVLSLSFLLFVHSTFIFAHQSPLNHPFFIKCHVGLPQGDKEATQLHTCCLLELNER